MPRTASVAEIRKTFLDFQQVGGKGGGKPDMAMAGGTDASGLPKALASVQAWVTERV